MKKYEEVLTYYYPVSHYKDLVLENNPDYFTNIPMPFEVVNNLRKSIEIILTFLKGFKNDKAIKPYINEIYDFKDYMDAAVDNNIHLYKPDDPLFGEVFAKVSKEFNVKYVIFNIDDLLEKYKEINRILGMLFAEKERNDTNFQNVLMSDKNMPSVTQAFGEFINVLTTQKTKFDEIIEKMNRYRSAPTPSNDEQCGFELWHSSSGHGLKKRHSFLLKEFEYDFENEKPYNKLSCLSSINVCKDTPFKIMARGYFLDIDDGINKVHINFKYLDNDEAAAHVADQILTIVNENW